MCSSQCPALQQRGSLTNDTDQRIRYEFQLHTHKKYLKGWKLERKSKNKLLWTSCVKTRETTEDLHCIISGLLC
ncbi:hypothetical protein AOLI_G00194180 [Acnodon oligacanthus]